MGVHSRACPSALISTLMSYLPLGEVNVTSLTPSGEITPSLLSKIKAAGNVPIDTPGAAPTSIAERTPETRHSVATVQLQGAAAPASLPPLGGVAALAPTHQRCRCR